MSGRFVAVGAGCSVVTVAVGVALIVYPSRLLTLIVGAALAGAGSVVGAVFWCSASRMSARTGGNAAHSDTLARQPNHRTVRRPGVTPRRDQLLTTSEAADLAGLTPARFRSEVTRSPTLREAKVMLDGRTPAYPRRVVQKWIRSRPGKGAPGRPRQRRSTD